MVTAAPCPTKNKPELGRVLVIGGCGFLGHHVVRLLLRDWATRAIGVVDLNCTRNRRPASDGVAYLEADITDLAGLTSIMGAFKPDLIVHTASPAAASEEPRSDALFRRVNVGGTRCVVEAARAARAKALVYTSSASVISDHRTDLVNADERWPILTGAAQPEYYSATKAEAELLVLEANGTGERNLLTCAIRPSGILGEGDAQLLYHLINIYRKGRTGWQIGQNENLFDFTYVENVAHCHLLAAVRLLATHAAIMRPLDQDRVDGEAFLCTNDTPLYFWDLPRAVWRAAGSELGTEHVWVLGRGMAMALGFVAECWAKLVGKPPTFTRARIQYSTLTRYFNIRKAKTRLGYVPLVSLEEGMRKSVKWFLDQEREKNK